MSELEKQRLANLRASFDRFDTDKSGFIDREEMRAAVKFVCKQIGVAEHVAIAEADAIIEDSNEVGVADNKISFEEFVEIFGRKR